VNGHPKYFSDEPDPSAWLKVLAEVRRMAPRQGYRFLHVQAVIVAIDQYAEAATGNRYYFLDNPTASVGVAGTATFRSPSGQDARLSQWPAYVITSDWRMTALVCGCPSAYSDHEAQPAVPSGVVYSARVD
jgi:hypothetical protein